MVKSRNWCFVYNNPPEELDLTAIFASHPTVVYAVWQLERGEEGTPHYQGYVQFSTQASHTHVHAYGAEVKRGHWQPARGNPEQNEVYCTKEPRLGGPWRYGRRKQQGKRTDLDDFAERIDSGERMRDIAGDHPGTYIRYHRGLMAYRTLRQKPVARPDLTVICLWGPTGVGKSRWVTEAVRDKDACYIQDDEGGWMGLYCEQDIIVFDEFSGLFPMRSILQIVDRAPATIRSKGGHAVITANHIVFTSNIAPERWYPDVEPWLRRLREPWVYSLELKEETSVDDITDMLEKMEMEREERLTA